ncbi:hypothetical protein [Streptomyces sp. t39]|uniref:hypothetical protein n=1 Tax=Streptomyces sp. t39 TaxID=1828156 RepID=UPI0011CD794A|nr:hypothetical protein [Streptomyces sp. t39]TXS50125.1 hypothetical protein EAO77_27840 [Streptomyces sp. t39]
MATPALTQASVEDNWRQSGRHPQQLTDWQHTTTHDGAPLISARIRVDKPGDVLREFAARRTPILADYLQHSTGDTLPAMDYSLPGRAALVWRTGGVWVELWHPDPPSPSGGRVRPTPALLAQRPRPVRTAPSDRLPYQRLRDAFKRKENTR